MIKVALMPPKSVKTTIPRGNRKTVAAVGTPVKFSITAAPPVKSMAVTRMLVKQQKTMKTPCVAPPYLIVVRELYQSLLQYWT